MRPGPSQVVQSVSFNPFSITTVLSMLCTWPVKEHTLLRNRSIFLWPCTTWTTLFEPLFHSQTITTVQEHMRVLLNHIIPSSDNACFLLKTDWWTALLWVCNKKGVWQLFQPKWFNNKSWLHFDELCCGTVCFADEFGFQQLRLLARPTFLGACV